MNLPVNTVTASYRLLKPDLFIPAQTTTHSNSLTSPLLTFLPLLKFLSLPSQWTPVQTAFDSLKERQWTAILFAYCFSYIRSRDRKSNLQITAAGVAYQHQGEGVAARSLICSQIQDSSAVIWGFKSFSLIAHRAHCHCVVLTIL